MQPDLVSLIAGLIAVAVGLLLMWSHRVAWVRQQQEFIDDLRELKHLQARYRRRMQTSGLIAIVGVLIPIADLPILWRNLGAAPATLLWMAIVSVCIWIGVLAIGDWATTRAHSQATLARLQTHKNELMEQLERLRPDVKRDEPSEQS
jgi:hypothetical protein